ncbi:MULTISPECIES: hypothetical protein [Brevibacillus]|uniref:Isochorismatase family protein n=1 Tax=Brevibacillus invocatus TaxID=173959 RepID=A0A3M8C137_9BACL|nr:MULTISPECIES: hypothetical protein [Brevibacillus]MDH4619637.1 hypothetical protein [Brevibacillus sp. AY1]RNB69374.1 hypothetical protein EDM52_19115 [Brevibacillus invocatus]
MKTPFHELFDETRIGRTSEVRLNHLLQKATQENISPASADKRKTLFLAIDMQNDFMEQGELGVPGSHLDVSRAARFLYDHMEKITQVAISLDTHQPQQIFHPGWWVDDKGNHPAPFTIITHEDVQLGKWRALTHQTESLDYVSHLAQNSKKELCIWPYHCLEGSFGAALEGQFANMVYYHSVARKAAPLRIVKGKDPLSEMYGIIKPEYGPHAAEQLDFLESLRTYEYIFVVGEAKSHCVLESLRQILEYYEADPSVTSRIVVLEDCMSSIPGFEAAAEDAFTAWQKAYKISVTRSTDFTW